MMKILAACSLISLGSSGSPADLISGAGKPLFKLAIDDGFKLSVSILLRTAPTGEDSAGIADFTISVGFPGATPVSVNCPGEEYFFEDGAVLFDSYSDDESCTGKFRLAMNQMLGQTIVTAPIPLVWSAADKSLTVSIGAEVKIPFAGHVN